MVTKVIRKGEPLDQVESSGASIVWYGGIYLGSCIVVAGIIWLLVNQHVIEVTLSMVLSVLTVLLGIGIVVFSLYLKKVISAVMR